MAITEKVYSDYEVRTLNFIFGTGASKRVVPVKCVGSLEEESEVRTTTKKCGGVVAKKRTRGTGAGTLKATMHMPWALFVMINGMEDEQLIDGVYAYGKGSVHPEFCITADVFDEDDVEKFRAYPRCVANTGPARKTTNGEEEVAELEAEIGWMPDEHGNGVYEALADELADEQAKAGWLEAFTPELVRVKQA